MKTEQRAEDAKRFSEMESRKYSEKAIYYKAMQEAQIFIANAELEKYLTHLELTCLKDYGHLNQATFSWISTARKLSSIESPVRKRIKFLNNPLANND